MLVLAFHYVIFSIFIYIFYFYRYIGYFSVICIGYRIKKLKSSFFLFSYYLSFEETNSENTRYFSLL